MTSSLPLTLGTLKNNTRDGQLIVVSPDHTRYAMPQEYKNLQSALEDWDNAEKILHAGSLHMQNHPDAGLPLPDFSHFHSPLPRAYQWVDGSAYVNHVELVRKARGAIMPESFWTDPLMYQGASDSFIGPHDAIVMADEAYGIDMEAEVAVITDDVPMAISAEKGANHIKLLMLVNDVSLRNLIPNELAKGFGFLHGKPATAFSPFAITPAVLGDAWKDCKVHIPLNVEIKRNGENAFSNFGHPNAGEDMTFNFGELISHAAKTRHLHAGTIVGSGTVSNLDRSRGSCCIAERRMLEVIDHGKPNTSFLNFGDKVRIFMDNYFGEIHQEIKPYI